MGASVSALLKGSPDAGSIERLERALKQLPERGAEAETALTATLWYRISGHRNGILAVFQFGEGYSREERLWRDLSQIGATEAAEVTRAMFAEIGIEWGRLAKDLPTALEAGDRILMMSRGHADETNCARKALPGQLWAYLCHHAHVVDALDALPAERSLLARLFQR